MSEDIIRMLGQKYPELTDEIHQKYRAGIGGVLIWKKSDPDYDPIPDLVRVAAFLGYHAGQQDAKAGRDIRDREEVALNGETGTQTDDDDSV
jgi:hypothetical protein